MEGFEPMHKYKILSFNKNAWLKIHIRDKIQVKYL